MTAPSKEPLTEDEKGTWTRMMRRSMTLENLRFMFKEAYKLATELNDATAIREFTKVKDEQKKRLEGK